MAKRKLMTVEKDAEEIFNVLYSEQKSSILDHELQDVDKLQMIFMPTKDGLDSDKDDAPSGAGEGKANIKNIGRGVLSQVVEVRAIVEHGKRDVSIDSSQLVPTTRGGVVEDVLGLEDVLEDTFSSPWPWPRSSSPWPWPQVLENWPVLGSRTALFFELLKFCGALEKFLENVFLWRSLEKFL